MKIIDLLNKIANKEKLPNKVLIKDVVYYLINDTDGNIVYSQAKDERNWASFIDHRLNVTRCLNANVLILDNEFELIEDEEIDINSIKEFEIDENDFIQTDLGAFKTRKMDIAFLNKINELAQAVKQLDKRTRKEKE